MLLPNLIRSVAFRRFLEVAAVSLLLLGLMAHSRLRGCLWSSLPIPLPSQLASQQRHHPGLAPSIPIRTVSSSSRLAITFLDIDHNTDKDAVDWYYVNLRLLMYQLLYAPETKNRHANAEWLVIAAKGIEQWRLDRLRSDDAKLYTVDALEVPSWIGMQTDRYVNVFAALPGHGFMGWNKHPTPPAPGKENSSDYFNTGWLVFAPAVDMFECHLPS
jgi:hypothetical protein